MDGGGRQEEARCYLYSRRRREIIPGSGLRGEEQEGRGRSGKPALL